jgi:hypothetical protein
MEKYCTPGQATDDNMAHAHCTLDTKGYRHTLRICNTYCFSIATMVARTRFIVTLYVHCLPWLSVILIPFLNINRTCAPILTPQSKHSSFVSCLYICVHYMCQQVLQTPQAVGAWEQPVLSVVMKAFLFTKKTGGIDASGTNSVWEHSDYFGTCVVCVVRLLLPLTAP